MGGRIHQRWVVRLVAPYLYVQAMLGLVLNPRNVDGPVLRRLAWVVLDDVPVTLLQQFASWIQRNAWDTITPHLDLRAGLAQVACPVMLMSGSVDRLAPPEGVAATFAELGSADKKLQIAGKVSGWAEEYGHGDLIFGRRAPTEVFPSLLSWIEARQPAS